MDHRIKARKSLPIGEIRKGERLENVGREISLENSFRASAKGWGIPMRLTLFGPFRF